MTTEIVSDKLVSEYKQWSRTWREGDKFSLRDIDGGLPTGEYTIGAIRVQMVRHWTNGPEYPRVHFMDREGGGWVNIVNVVPFTPKDTREEYVRRIVALLNEAIEEHGPEILWVPCEHGGCDHPVTEARDLGAHVRFWVDDSTFLNEG